MIYSHSYSSFFFLQSERKPSLTFASETADNSSNNCNFLVPACREELFPIADIVTPNLKEASALLDGLKILTVSDMRSAAKLLHDMGPRLVTGTS